MPRRDGRRTSSGLHDLTRQVKSLAAKNWASAWALLQEAWDFRIRLDAVCCNAALTALTGREGRWRQALVQVKAMTQQKLLPTSFTLNLLISCVPPWQRASHLLDALIGPCHSLRADVVSFGSAMTCYQEQRQWALAFDTYGAQRNSGVPLNPVTRSVLLSTEATAWPSAVLLFAQLKAEKLVESDFMCHSMMKSLSPWPMILNTLETMKLFRLMPTTISISSVMSSCEKGFQWSKAMELIHGVRRVRPNEVSYGSSISASTKGTLWSLSLAQLYRMGSKGLPRSRILLNLALSSCEKGAASGYECWRMVLTLLSLLISSALPNDVTYNATLSACEKSKQWRASAELLEQMAFSGIRIDVISMDAAGLVLSPPLRARRSSSAQQHHAQRGVERVPPAVASGLGAPGRCGTTGTKGFLHPSFASRCM
ncbi:unnamed protein product [Durusdinium trenchii]|uniref:Pentatricopeptide repeat-containing protein n=1 Tax=Durusdinium trenchii TaxID=1381693 RepID=A0ABP0N3G3_9DINO